MQRTPVLSLGIALILGLAGGSEAAAQAASGNPPPPPPGSPAVYLSHGDLEAALAASTGAGDEPAVSAVARADAYRGSIVRRTRPHGAIAHPGYTELHYIIEGSGAATTGGTIVRTDGAPAAIEGGETRRVAVGDILIIPPGSAHMYSVVDEPITYLEFRFQSPE